MIMTVITIEKGSRGEEYEAEAAAVITHLLYSAAFHSSIHYFLAQLALRLACRACIMGSFILYSSISTAGSCSTWPFHHVGLGEYRNRPSSSSNRIMQSLLYYSSPSSFADAAVVDVIKRQSSSMTF